jgi:ABC-type transport system substrate-binding protein
VTLFAFVPIAGSPAGAGTSNPNADPKGVARYGVNFVNFLFQDNFNPPQSISVDAEYVFFDYLYDTLLDQNTPGTKVIGGLAESFTIVDPNTLELMLR